jgi:molybdate transport system substrate-binding protein
VIGTFPEDSYPPIVYPVAATKTAKPDVVQYLDFLSTGIARTKFEAYGFSVLVQPRS